MTDILIFILILATVLLLGTLFLGIASILHNLGDEIEEEMRKPDNEEGGDTWMD